MEISDEQLEKMFAKQADRVAKEWNIEMKKWQQESDERMERYIGALKEDTDDKFQTIFEYVQDIPAMKEKLDLLFDKVGELTEKDTLLTEVAKDHKVRLQRLEQK